MTYQHISADSRRYAPSLKKKREKKREERKRGKGEERKGERGKKEKIEEEEEMYFLHSPVDHDHESFDQHKRKNVTRRHPDDNRY